jgi:hypothetical protein
MFNYFTYRTINIVEKAVTLETPTQLSHKNEISHMLKLEFTLLSLTTISTKEDIL